MTASVRVPGRTRWTVFDAQAEFFYVNIAVPAQILVLASDAPDRVARTITIPAPGPHGLDFDPEHRRLFCACDAKQLVIPESRFERGFKTDRAKRFSGRGLFQSGFKASVRRNWRSWGGGGL